MVDNVDNESDLKAKTLIYTNSIMDLMIIYANEMKTIKEQDPSKSISNILRDLKGLQQVLPKHQLLELVMTGSSHVSSSKALIDAIYAKIPLLPRVEKEELIDVTYSQETEPAAQEEE